MVDDWNIKKMRMDTVWYHNFYDGASIEYLRQKLIEDFEFVFCNQESKYRNNKYKEIILSIINKRFGVDTD